MKKLKRAFTIIELIIVVSISSILVGSAVLSYSQYSQSANLDREADKLIDVLRLAHMRARAADAGPLKDICVNPRQLTGYEVAIQNNVYTIAMCCDFNCTSSTIGGTTTSHVQATYNLPTNITIDTGYSAVVYRIHAINTEDGLTQLYNVFWDTSRNPARWALAPVPLDVAMVLKNNNSNQCIDVRVSATGVVSRTEIYSEGC